MSLITERVTERVEPEPAQIFGPLDNPLPAPTVSGILADHDDLVSRRAYPFYAHRFATIEGLSIEEEDALRLQNQDQRIVATTEADALSDFDAKMTAVAGLLHAFGSAGYHHRYADLLDRFRAELAFVGHKEFATATDAIAAHWLNVLNQSREGELHVVVDSRGSSLYIFHAVRKALEKLNPDAAGQLRPLNRKSINLLTEEEKERVARDGVRLVDDWLISGSQMRGLIADTEHYFHLRPEQIEVDLLCGTDESLRDGLDGVRCNAPYKYRYNESLEVGRISLTGTHCDTDFGFTEIVNNSYGAMNELVRERRACGFDDGIERLPYPLLYKVARVYKPGAIDKRCQRLDSPEKFAPLDGSLAEFSRIIDEMEAEHSARHMAKYGWLPNE